MRFVSGLTEPPKDLEVDTLREAVAVDEVALAVLFGSFASGDQGPLSDLDIAIKFRDEVPRSRRLERLDGLTGAIVTATGIEAVDLVDLETVGPAVGYDALAHGVLLHGDRSDAIALETAFLLRKLDFQPVKRTWDQALDARLREGRYGRP